MSDSGSGRKVGLYMNGVYCKLGTKFEYFDLTTYKRAFLDISLNSPSFLSSYIGGALGNQPIPLTKPSNYHKGWILYGKEGLIELNDKNKVPAIFGTGKPFRLIPLNLKYNPR